MAETGWPEARDATHVVRAPGRQGGPSGGERGFAAALARSASAFGAAGFGRPARRA